MPDFRSFDETRIVYDDEGSGPLVLLLHGFAADAKTNWRAPGILDAIVEAGFRVVAPDARGHGRSERPHDPAAYENGAMGRDVSALLDHLGVGAVQLVGYSMGAMVAGTVALDEKRVRSVVLGGIGDNVLRSSDEGIDREAIAAALEAEAPSESMPPVARAFRAFADSTGADRIALAAIQRANRTRTPPDQKLDVPVLVVLGEADVLAGKAEPLAALHPRGRAVTTPGDHLSAIAEPALCEAIVRFLNENREA